ncbi:diguanylate cyclase [Myxococcota bacterium]|nr:diguanylate cyclase [Myxococcota bacterium]
MKLNTDLFHIIMGDLNEGVYCQDLNERITYWNKAAETITGHKEWEVLGRICSDDIFRHLDTEGNPMCGTDLCPRKSAMGDCSKCDGDFFIHTKDGQVISVSSKHRPLNDSQGNLIGSYTVFSDRSLKGEIKAKLEELEKLTLLDALTEVGNRRFAEINLANSMEKYRRYGHGFGLLFIDIDHFKNVNDEYGHKIGDNILRMVALVLKYSMRSFDVVARWGGEEFVTIVFDVSEAQLSDIAERTRKLVGHAHVLNQGAPVKVTASIGATLVQDDDTVETIVERADKAMYASKMGGRNRVTGSFTPLNL